MNSRWPLKEGVVSERVGVWSPLLIPNVHNYRINTVQKKEIILIKQNTKKTFSMLSNAANQISSVPVEPLGKSSRFPIGAHS